MRITLLAAVLILMSGMTVWTQDPPPKDPPSSEHPKLPPGSGREVMIRVCSTCHEAEKVVDQQFDAAGWKTVVDQMAAQGADATDAELEAIVQYLAKAFPETK